MKVKVKAGNVNEFMKDNLMMRYILVLALVVLLGFSVFYVYNVQKEAHKEPFEDAKYTITYVYMNGCGYCEKFNSTWDSFVVSNTTHVLQKYEQGQQQAQAYIQKYNIHGFPTVIIEDPSGKKVASHVGNADLRTFDAFVKTNTTFVAYNYLVCLNISRMLLYPYSR